MQGLALNTQECSGSVDRQYQDHICIRFRKRRERLNLDHYRVTIKNLAIYFPPQEQSDASFEDPCWIDADLEFKDCIMLSQSHMSWKLGKSEERCISFTNCIFREVSVEFLQNPLPWSPATDAKKRWSSIGLKDTSFISDISGGFAVQTTADNLFPEHVYSERCHCN